MAVKDTVREREPIAPPADTAEAPEEPVYRRRPWRTWPRRGSAGRPRPRTVRGPGALLEAGLHHGLRHGGAPPGHPRAGGGRRSRAATSASPASSPTPAASIPPATGASSGPCGSSPASAPPPTPTSASSTCSPRGRPASPSPSTCRPSTATTPTTRCRKGEVGKCGVAVDTLADMETLFDGIPLGEVTTSMTINSTAPILFAMYLAVAEKQGVDIAQQVSGTLQNDILKEYIAQKEYIYPPRPSMRLITDQFAFAAQHVPRWNTISISGYHIREAGSTALQELAFTLRDGMEYVQYGIDAGLDVDEFAPRLSFFFNSHNDFFEEIAKFRAARQIWATVMRERYGAKNPRSWMLRFHTQTAGCSLTAQQPINNVVRTTVQALAAVLGGTQSLHTNSLDETLALPTEENARIGAAHPADPRPRVGGDQHRRPAGRQLVRRGDDPAHGRRRLRLLPAHRRLRRHGRGDRGRLPAARDHGRRLRLPAGVRGARRS